eukprot:6200611-Pleurochrysis_carterae.AAC.2
MAGVASPDHGGFGAAIIGTTLLSVSGGTLRTSATAHGVSGHLPHTRGAIRLGTKFKRGQQQA